MSEAQTERLPENLVLRGGVYQVRRMKDGTLHRISTGCKDLQSAIKKARKINSAIDDGEDAKKKKLPVLTLREWWQKYTDTYAKREKAKTAENKKNAFARVLDLLGDQNLDALTESDFVAYVVWREGGPRPGDRVRMADDGAAGAPNTIRHELAVIHAVLNKAIRNGLLTKNPCTAKKPEYVTRMRVLLSDEQALLFPALLPEYQRLATVFIGTGLRANELLKLEEGDINFDDGIILLPAKKAKGGKKGRTIPMFPEVVQALRDQLAARAANTTSDFERPGGTKRKNTTAVFNMGRESALQTFRDAGNSVDIAEFTIHDFRRTFGTRCAEAGCPIKHLSEVMGHSDIAITAKYYVHLGAENLKHTILKLDLGLTAKKPGKKLDFKRG